MQTGTNFSESFTTIYEDELSFLEKTVDDYPVSALSLFLLLQNYKKTGNDRYDQLIQKAALYFPNYTWLNYQLSGDEAMNYSPEKVIDAAEEEETYTETLDPFEAIFAEPEIDSENQPELPDETTPGNSIEAEAIREMEKEEMVEFVQGEEADNFEKNFVENQSNTEEEVNTENSLVKISQQENNAEEAIEIENKIQQDLSEEHIQEDSPAESSEEINITPEEIHASNPSESINPEIAAAEEIPVKPSAANEGEPEETEENHTLEFEPLHTIDYFASQGIIIKEEALMNDKLGKQMKSFTDWLKSMKKLHPGKLPEQNEVVEKIIQSSAELSNEDAGVLTEAMADVLIKQGKRGKAIEMFEKLSLMNPSKSIYFAAKIESLKK
ncbi:MAG: hypothetical protein ABIW47_07330 [Ginsengibacter sp.]|jgi:hypothetical protein